MPTSASRSWFSVSLFIALLYVIIGLVTIALSRVAPRGGILVVIRGASWLTSALVFVVHIAYESRFQSSASRTAAHTAIAVAIATEVLALIATGRLAVGGSVRPAMLVALVVWPLLTGIVSFLVASVLAVIFRRLQAKAGDAEA
jgi:hypothetical protein